MLSFFVVKVDRSLLKSEEGEEKSEYFLLVAVTKKGCPSLVLYLLLIQQCASNVVGLYNISNSILSSELSINP